MIGIVTSRRLVAVFVTALALTLGSSEHAFAGTYVMRSCNVPGAPSASVGSWRWEYALHTVAFDDCSKGGGFGFTLPNTQMMTRVSSASMLLARPATGPKSVIGIRRVRLWMVARLTGAGSSMFVVTTTATADGGGQQTDLFAKPGGNTVNAPYVSPWLPQDLTKFRVVLACSGSTHANCYPSEQRPLEIRGTELTLEEDVPPVVELRGGTIASGVPQSGARSVSYVARDDASGVTRVEGLLGDTVVGVKDLSGACRHSDFNACPVTQSDDLVVNTRLVPNGRHAFRVRVTDAAGNRNAAQLPGTVTIDNGTTARSNLGLVARFVGAAASRGTTLYGRRVSVRGRLTDTVGHGIPTARIHVTERRLLGGKTIRTADVTTRSDGRFSYMVWANAPSRSIRFQFGERDVGAAITAARTLKLRVRAVSGMELALKGVRVRYRGRVVSRPLPRGGKLVLIQGRVPRGIWQTFATRRTDRRGRFNGRYRLRVYRPGVRLQFRVRIPAESGYPYAPGASRVLTRRVR